MFQKHIARLAFSRKTTAPKTTTRYTTDRCAYTAYACIRQLLNNSATDVETTLQHYHKLVVAHLSTKLAREGTSFPEKPQTYR